jgi:hypothetical protein
MFREVQLQGKNERTYSGAANQEPQLIRALLTS